MKPEVRIRPFKELRVVRSDDEPSKITGYPIVFGEWSGDLGGFREIVTPEAGKGAVARGGDFVSLYNHDSNYVIGRTSAGTLTLTVDDIGVYMEADVPDTQWARDLLVSIERGDVRGGSFQFYTKKDAWNADYTERELMDFELIELGPVVFPAYPATSAAVRERAMALAEEEHPARAGETDEDFQGEIELIRFGLDLLLFP